MGARGSDWITSHELAVAGGQNAAVGEREFTGRPDCRDNHKFAIREVHPGGSRGVGFELQSVATAERETLRFAYIERIELRIFEPVQRITGIDHRASLHKPVDSTYVAPLAPPHIAIENNDMIGGIEASVLLLRSWEGDLPERCNSFFRLGQAPPPPPVSSDPGL